MERRASISGLTFSSTKNHIVRAALESIPYQIKDVITAMEKDSGVHLKQLMIDGGITANQFVMSFISGLLNKNVVSIGIADVSALGAALIAGLKPGVYKDLETLQQLNTEREVFAPNNQAAAAKAHEGWLKAIHGS
jgi:glycerol kinase